MKTNLRLLFVLGGVAAVALVACGGSVGTGGAPAPVVDPDLPALDAQATLAVWSAQGTAVAEATRVAAQSTADAQAAIVRATADTAAAWATGTTQAAIATNDASARSTAVALSTAQAAQAAATATWDALRVQAEAVAVQQTADAGAYSLSATATADAGIVAFMEAEAAKTIQEREAEIARQVMWNRVTPWLVGAVVLAAVGLVFLVVGGLVVERVRRARPQPAGDTWVMWHPEGPRVIAPPAPPRALLPAPQPRLTITPPPTPRADDEEVMTLPAVRHGHVLVAGETGSGKSTALRAILSGRRNVVVLDPHWDGQDWNGARVIGGGRDFEAIRQHMDWMGAELRRRYEERSGGRLEFEPHTVAVDEMPAIVSAVGRDIEATWREWLREGRKVGLFLVLSTQSTRVRTLGIEGEKDLLENFSVVLVLGDLARQEYRGLVEGMDRPAVLHTRGKARPVIIPHAPEPDVVEGPVGDLDGNGRDDALLFGRPLFTAPTPVLRADPRNMTAHDVERIRQLLANGMSQRGVEKEVFGYTGGAAWRAVAAVSSGEDIAAVDFGSYSLSMA